MVHFGSDSYYITSIIKDDDNIGYSSIKKFNQETNLFEDYFNVESEIIKFKTFQYNDDREIQFVWISSKGNQNLLLTFLSNNERVEIDLGDVYSYINDVKNINNIYTFDDTIYFEVCESSNRYLGVIQLLDTDVEIYTLGTGIGCNSYFSRDKRKIFFSFLKPLEDEQDINSVFVQTYDIDSDIIGDSVLVHQSGDNPSFSPQFILVGSEKLKLFWTKSFGGVFNSKDLYSSGFSNEKGWSDSKSVYQTERLILEFRPQVNLSNSTILIHEYDLVEKKQYLIKFNFIENKKSVLHTFDEKVVAFGETGSKYFLFLKSD